MTPPADLSALVAELRKLDEAAMPGPWRNGFSVGSVQSRGVFDGAGQLVCQVDYRGDTNFIAAVRNALPQLLAAAEERDALRAALEKCERALRYCLDDGCASAIAKEAIAAAEKALGRGK